MKTWSQLKGTERYELLWNEGPLADHQPDREYRFHPFRRWRFDYAWPSERVAVEIHGFGFGHQSLKQMANDREKIREAILHGWRVLEYTSRCLGSRAKVEDAVMQTCMLLSGATFPEETQ